MSMEVIAPPWARPGGRLFGKVAAFSTTRAGGVSAAPYDSLNVGLHVADDEGCVVKNRSLLIEALALPSEPKWLDQVHGQRVIDAKDWQSDIEADAMISREPCVVLPIMTADCLPILLASDDGSVVAAVHAGWRGLASGIIDNVATAMGVAPASVLAWIGPGIGSAAFEVGDEVREAFVEKDHLATNCFVPNANNRWQADLKMLAVLALRRNGIARVTDCGHCTFADERRYFSHRRSAPCGRMASLIWIT